MGSDARHAWLVLLLILAPFAHAQETRPRILVSNDDGLPHEGIITLADELRKFADVVVVAPSEDRTGASQSSVIRTITSRLAPFRRGEEIFGYTVNATPADAVMFGVMHFGAERPFDLVVSGINEGANAGMISHYSGTVGAAKEGAIRGIPAIATSQATQRTEYEVTARITAELAKLVLEEGLPPGVILSLNVPAGELKGVRVARTGGTYFGVNSFRQVGEAGDTLLFQATVRGARNDGNDTDTAYYMDGWVTVAPIQLDWTRYDLLDRVSRWGLSVEP